MKYDVYYQKPRRGHNWTAEGVTLEGVITGKTHALLLASYEARDCDQAWMDLQAGVQRCYWDREFSSPAEANALLDSKGLRHTSMSVGDVLHNLDTGQWIVVDRVGWKHLAGPAYPEVRIS